MATITVEQGIKSLEKLLEYGVREINQSDFSISDNTAECRRPRERYEFLSGPPDLNVDEISKDLFFPLKYITNAIPKIRASTKFAEKIRKGYVWPSETQLTNFVAKLEAEIPGTYVEYFSERLNSQSTGRPLVANANPDTVNALAKFLCSKSIFIRDSIYGQGQFMNYDSTQLGRKATVFLIGPPGTGKTTFINYLCTRNRPIFHKKKVIDVRIDLNRREHREVSIKDCLLGQFMYLYREHYYERDPFRFNDVQLARYWVKYLGAKKDQEKKSAASYATQMIEYIQKRRFELLDPSFVNALLEYLAEERDCAFLFILDGMDYVTLDEVHLDDFSSWLKQLPERLPDHGKQLVGLYLIVMREYNFAEYMGQNMSVYRQPPGPPHVFSVLPGCLMDVLSAKIDLGLLDARTYHKPVEGDLKTTLIDDDAWCNRLKSQLELFLGLCVMGPDELKSDIRGVTPDQIDGMKRYLISSGYLEMANISSCNYRALMIIIVWMISLIPELLGTQNIDEFLTLSVDDLLNRLEAKEWQVNRLITMGYEGYFAYHTPFEYSVERTLNGTYMIKFDSYGIKHLVPNILSFAYPNARCREVERTSFRPLVKLRVLQLLDKCGPLSIEHIADWFNEAFGYDRDFLRADLRAMIFTQLVQTRYPESDGTQGYRTISLTPLGRFILERMIYKFIYYELIVDDVPVPANIYEELHGFVMSPKARYETRYMFNKFRSVYLLLNVLAEVESQEEGMFNSAKVRLPGKRSHFSFQENGFALIDAIKDGVRSGMTRNLLKCLRTSSCCNQIIALYDGLGLSLDVDCDND